MDKTLGRYQIIEIIGRGGMATVYRAHDPSFNRDVAIKIISPQSLGVTGRARFQREAHTIARLAHSAIVPVFDLGVQDDQLYYAMAYMPGGSLAERIVQEKLTKAEVMHVIDRIAAALDAARRQNVIHRDVKPANILFDQHGDAYLSDFGIVKLIEDTTHLTTSELLGTPAYMAPEIGDPDGITPLLDVYALGVTLFQMLTGELPFQADTPMGMMAAHISRPVPDIRVLRPDLALAIQPVIEKALAKDPKMRFQSAGEFAQALRAALTNTSFVPAATDASETVLTGWMQTLKHKPRQIWMLTIGAVILIAILAVVMRPLISSSSEFPPGESIAYLYALRDGDHYGEYFLSLMNADGTSQSSITDTASFSPLFAWSRDGRRLAAFSHDSRSTAWIEDAQADDTLVIINLDGSATIIHKAGMPLSYPAWSPDGSLIAYDCGERDICLLSTDGSQEKILPADVALLSSPQTTFSWSSDGRQLLYSCEPPIANGNAAICVSDLKTAEVARVDYMGDDTDPAWSPDGTRFAFISQYDGSRPQETNEGNGILVTTISGMGEPQKIANFPSGNYLAGNLTWSPDGKYLALIGEDLDNLNSQGADMIVAAVDGSMSRIVHAHTLIREPIHWSPNGMAILYDGQSGLSTDIFLLSIPSGNVLNLTDHPAVDSEPNWSPDGNWIVFTSNRDGSTDLYKMDASGRDLTRLTVTSGDESAPLWSP
jgi:serine/threonine-protein kinase